MFRWLLILVLLLSPFTARAQTDQLCFVQFIHPGGEHEPDSAAGRSWNTGQHKRTFIQQAGRYLTDLNTAPIAANLMFWCEYEAPAALVKTFTDPLPDGPKFLFAPAPMAFYPHDPPLMNTDPFVFGNHFFYSICKQNNRRGPTGLQRLARGSVILFGSGKHRSQFIVDTVFVVADYIDFNLTDYRETLKDRVPSEYFHATLEPVVYEMQLRNHSPSQTFRLYIGATPDQPIEGMFSFFPCRPFSNTESRGFARPTIRRKGTITDNLTQGQRMNPQPDLAAVQILWSDVTRQILEQGLCLGVQAELPKIKELHEIGKEIN
ncbi:MAG: hypothetical protein RBS84_07945 [Kiritimatiellia bacterium]|jgi:hypothetical protein|nr:hypothetical protein [Kiritimatiellia bacterium]